MFDYGLSTQQLDVICALSNGATLTAAAEQAGIHRNTINNWRRNLLPFQYALADAQYDRAMHFREKTEELADLAIQTLHDILTDPKAPASVRLKAALAVIQTAATPPLPKKQIQLNFETVQVERPVHKPAQSPAPPSAPDPAPAAAPTVHNTAQPIRRESPKIGRNELCPCGSGQKFKRCCLNKPQATAAA